MSGNALMAIMLGASVVAGAICVLLFRLTEGEWVWEPWLVKRKKKKESKGSEVGTIRIVEKMDKDGKEYYVVWYFNRGYPDNDDKLSWKNLWMPGGDCPMHFCSVDEAQIAANAEIDRREAVIKEDVERKKRAAHHKIMGEFKP